jgi:hypothetical protein
MARAAVGAGQAARLSPDAQLVVLTAQAVLAWPGRPSGPALSGKYYRQLAEAGGR